MPEKILVVDDDVDTLRLVGLMLQRQGYQIVAANNGQQALVMAQNENPDLILLDVMMPDMDGYEVTRRLRADPSTQQTPIIMFTAKSQVDDKVMGFEVGVDDYLTKPTQPRELFAHVKAMLARSKKARPAQPVEPAVVRERGHVVGVLAAKSGLGISTLTINLGISLQKRTRKRVVVAELRPGEGSLAMELGLAQPEGLTRLAQKKTSEISAGDVDSELIMHNQSGIRLLVASSRASDAKLALYPDRFEAISRHLAYSGDYILLDLGAGISPIADKVLEICDELVIPFEPTAFIIQRTQNLVDELIDRGFGEGQINVVLYNRIRTELQLSLQLVQQQLKQPIAVVFTPAPELAYQAAKNHTPLVIQHPDNLTTQQFLKLADLIGRHVRVKT